MAEQYRRARYRLAVELRQLEAFVAVASELHFGRASERLRLAPPTLSELIRRLERELGTPLFTRTTRRVALTSAGTELLARSKVILEEVAAARAAVSRIAEGEAGTVRLGITPPVAPDSARRPGARSAPDRRVRGPGAAGIGGAPADVAARADRCPRLRPHRRGH